MKNIKHIYCEDPYQKMWDMLVFFESEPITKNFLMKRYNENGYKDSFKLAFVNTSKFIYFIKQAKEYFISANKSNILVKPLLIYYGMMSLIKAVILTKDPDYPNKTGVLRHGITTRKLKKSNYHFHEDEIKIQKEGLLPWFYTIMHNSNDNSYTSNKIIEGNKYKIKDLLAMIPELHNTYTLLYNEYHMLPFTIKQFTNSSVELIFPINSLKIFTGDIQLIEQLNNNSYDHDNNFTLNNINNDLISIIWNGKITNPIKYANFFANKLLIQDIKGNYYLRKFTDNNDILPDILIDYMLMYNLGMLCRYETELWGEIIFSFTSEDMYIINEFVNLSMRKFPNLIINELFKEFYIFEIK